MENPRKSNIKKLRKQGFRARMRTKEGRKILNRQRALKNGTKKRKEPMTKELSSFRPGGPSARRVCTPGRRRGRRGHPFLSEPEGYRAGIDRNGPAAGVDRPGRPTSQEIEL